MQWYKQPYKLSSFDSYVEIKVYLSLYVFVMINELNSNQAL